jgi:hypothetical protein
MVARILNSGQTVTLIAVAAGLARRADWAKGVENAARFTGGSER